MRPRGDVLLTLMAVPWIIGGLVCSQVVEAINEFGYRSGLR